MSHLLPALLVAPIGAALASSVPGSESPSDETRPSVASVLHAETESLRPIDRRALLQDALEQNPNAAATRWQAGYLQLGGEWRPVEQIDTPDDRHLSEYRVLRATTPRKTREQVHLANWCAKHGLDEQERAHLTAALALSESGDLPQVRTRLGYRRVNGRWMTRDEHADARRFAREAEQSMKVWGRRLQSNAERLAGSRRQRESAIAELEAIDDPAALRAAELVLAGAGETAALQAVALFARFDRYESSLALARQATFSSWSSVRGAATEVLKSRRWDHFVPSLLAAMHRPAESFFQVLIGGRGELYYTHVSAREMADHWQVARYDVVNFLSSLRRRPRGRRAELARIDFVRAIGDDLRRRDELIERHNEQTEAFNERIGGVLAEVTGEEKTSDPQIWWNFWTHRTDVQPREKRVVLVSEEEQIGRPPHECLAPGTPVWTDRGPIPVEQIEIGDLVLSKDIETGELAYKPVVLTTARHAPNLVRLRVAGDDLETTAGHSVWVSGSGWTRARELSPGAALHTVTGTNAVESVEPIGDGTVYNLVVADFHTYFFGDSMILSHDTTIPKLTNVVVPGLPLESHSP